MHLLRTVAALAGLLAPVAMAAADQVTLTTDRDNSMYSEDGSLSSGAGPAMYSGRNNNGDRRRALVRFDLSSIPAGSTIDSVSLTLEVTNHPPGNTNHTYTIHRLLEDWGESDCGGPDGCSDAGSSGGSGDGAKTGDATWSHRFWMTQTWTTAGGDYVATASDSASVGNSDNSSGTWSSSTMISDVQGWIDAPATNFGWIVRGPEGQNQTARGFGTHENGSASERPELVVDFTPPGANGACCLPSGACTDVTETDCTTMMGTFQGTGTDCITTDCDGACCLMNGTCVIATLSECTGMSGMYQGYATTCLPNPCPDPTGACCFDDGNCLELNATSCSSMGGAYLADGTVCMPNPCPQPGACCFGDGSCLELLPAECTMMMGTFQGAGTVCMPNPCPQFGACCLPGAQCSIESSADCTMLGGAYQGDGTDCMPNPCPLNLTPFLDPLPIPAVAQPTSGTPGGAADYTIAMRQVQQQLHAQMPNPTTVWGYGDGPTGATFPGPTIEAFVGQTVTVDWVNDLRSSYPAGPLLTGHHLNVDLCAHGADDGPPKCVVHVHGAHVTADSDGYPEDHYPPGQSLLYTYPNNQLASTIWYHDHSLGKTRLNVYMGLAGFYLIRDAFEVDMATDLPRDQYEIPIAIQDRAFNQDGSLDYPDQIASMFFGDHMLANGKIWPFLDVERGKYRLRLLNGCGSRTLTLSFVDQTTMTPLDFDMIAAEGGFFSAPVTLNEVTLAPAERADVVIDFRGLDPATEVILTNSGPGPALPNVMKFNVGSLIGYTTPLQATWPAMEVLDEADAVQFRDFELARGTSMEPMCPDPWLINDLHWDHITEFPELGDTEVWSWINRSGMMHPMHMHLVFFQVLDRQPFTIVDGDVVTTGPPVAPSPEESGWKDTVRANPFEITRVIARFEDYTGLFAYHCHILEHEDHEMMRQFRAIPACPADTDGNLEVDIDDIVNVVLDFGGDGSGHGGDVTGNGIVDIDDIVAVVLAFGPCPLD